MQDGQSREIEISGVKVEELINSGYTLRLFASGKDFPNLNARLKGVAEKQNRPQEPLAYISYYPPAPNSEQPHAVNVSTWQPDTEHLAWNADKERTAASEEEARQLVLEVMNEHINYFRELDKELAETVLYGKNTKPSLSC